MKIELEMPSKLEEGIQTIIVNVVAQTFEELKIKMRQPEWMKLKEGARYASVSEATFKKWRGQGLMTTKPSIGGELVSKKAIDEFLETYQN